MSEPVLGTKMHSTGMVLKGRLTQMGWLDLMRSIVHMIGMEAVGEPAIWVYPMEGKGGQGQTIVLPITESFLALDTWPDHDGAYLLVCSCREYDVNVVARVAQQFGLGMGFSPDRVFYRELRLR